MNEAHVHLFLNHVPVMATLFGVVLLVIALARRDLFAQRLALVTLVVAAAAAVPVYFTGEGAEEVVEHLSGVSHQVIETHEDAAKIALVAILILGLVSVVGLWLTRGARVLSQLYVGTMLFLSLIAFGVVAWAANLGGQVRHTEIQANPSPAVRTHQADDD